MLNFVRMLSIITREVQIWAHIPISKDKQQ